jgi:hypothetical protein
VGQHDVIVGRQHLQHRLCYRFYRLRLMFNRLAGNALHLFWQEGEKRLPLERKALLGQQLLDEIVTRYDEKNRR